MQRIFISVMVLTLCACAQNADYQRQMQTNDNAFQPVKMQQQSIQQIHSASNYDPVSDYETVDDTVDKSGKGLDAPIDVVTNQQSNNYSARSVENSASRGLKICLYEARQLNRLTGNAYAAQVNELYRNIKAAQYYATVYAELSNNTSQMVTPLYKFKINDNCNTISQALLRELKKRVGPAGKN